MTKTKAKTSILFCLLAVFMTVEARGATKEVIINENFKELGVSNSVKVIYKPIKSGKAKAVITGDSEMVNHIKIFVEEERLHIGIESDRRGRNSVRGSATVTLTAPEISEILTSSGSSVTCDTPINLSNDDFNLKASSSSSITLKSITCKEAEISSFSGASITLNSITCDEAEILTSASSSITLNFLKCSDAEISSSSGSGVEVNAIKANHLEMSATSSASFLTNSLKVKYIDCTAGSGAKVKLSGHAEYGNLSAASSSTIDGRSMNIVEVKQKQSSGGRILL